MHHPTYPIYAQVKVTNELGEILLLKPMRRDLKFDYPEIQVDFGYHLGEAASFLARKLTGIDPLEPDPLHLYLWNDLSHLKMVFLFQAQVVKADVKVTLPEGYRRFQWLPPGVIKDHKSVDWFVKADFGGMARYGREKFAFVEDRSNA